MLNLLGWCILFTSWLLSFLSKLSSSRIRQHLFPSKMLPFDLTHNLIKYYHGETTRQNFAPTTMVAPVSAPVDSVWPWMPWNCRIPFSWLLAWLISKRNPRDSLEQLKSRIMNCPRDETPRVGWLFHRQGPNESLRCSFCWCRGYLWWFTWAICIRHSK